PEKLRLWDYHRTHVCQRTPAFAFHDERQRPTPLTEAEEQRLDRVIARLESICETSVECRIPLLIDAEHAHLQPAIDQLAMLMCLRFNDRDDGSGRPIVYNTYQMYLKDALYRLEQDTRFA